MPTCLPQDNFCKFNPTSCSHRNGTTVDVGKCKHANLEETYEQCKIFMDTDYRKRYGEWVYPGEDGKEIRTPKQSYRDRLCRLNPDNIFQETDNKTRLINVELDSSILQSNYHEFKFINLNQSNCKDQVILTLGKEISLFILSNSG